MRNEEVLHTDIIIFSRSHLIATGSLPYIITFMASPVKFALLL
jgi:hypothetical protein